MRRKHRHKRRRIANWVYRHYYFDRTGIWPRIRSAVERNGGIEGTKLDIMALMVYTCLAGIIAIAVWMAASGTLTWP